MSYATPFRSVIIRAADVAEGVWHLSEETPRSSDEGWDNWSGEYVMISGAPLDLVDGILADWPIGKRLGDRDLWVVDREPRVIAPGVYGVKINAKGLLGERGYKVRYRSAVEKTSPQGRTIIDGVGWNHAEVAQGDVTAQYSRVLVGAAPPTTLVGTANPGPPDGATFPAVRENVWATVSNPLYHYPNGWSLEGIDAEGLVTPEGETLGVWLCTWNYRFIHAITPA